jgi:alcohol dehydrogenase (cytochrome c)
VDGGTNWQNSAFDPRQGLIFVPTTESSSIITKQAPNQIARREGELFAGSGWSQPEPATRLVRALDAATGQRKWEYMPEPSASREARGSMSFRRDRSGLLATEGGVVFGASGGILFALDADTGRELWRVSLGGTTMSAPISFSVDGRQVIAVAAGRSLFVFGL